jgi:hypothetical protein
MHVLTPSQAFGLGIFLLKAFEKENASRSEKLRSKVFLYLV